MKVIMAIIIIILKVLLLLFFVVCGDGFGRGDVMMIVMMETKQNDGINKDGSKVKDKHNLNGNMKILMMMMMMMMMMIIIMMMMMMI